MFAVEIFASQTSDSSGNGEGTSFVASQNVTTNGSGNASFTINLAVIPGKSFFTATATNATTNDTSEFSNAILVANPGTFVFSSATYEVEEDTPGFGTITVNRVNGNVGAASVNYTTSNGSATAGSDYTTSAGTLNFVGGETSRTFIVPITNDTTAEPTETINLALSNPTGGTLGTPGTAVLTILEDEPLQSFEVNSSADTNDGACTANAGGCTLREALRLRHRHQLRRQLRLPRRPRPQRQRRRRD